MRFSTVQGQHTSAHVWSMTGIEFCHLQHLERDFPEFSINRLCGAVPVFPGVSIGGAWAAFYNNRHASRSGSFWWMIFGCPRSLGWGQFYMGTTTMENNSPRLGGQETSIKSASALDYEIEMFSVSNHTYFEQTDTFDWCAAQKCHQHSSLHRIYTEKRVNPPHLPQTRQWRRHSPGFHCIYAKLFI